MLPTPPPTNKERPGKMPVENLAITRQSKRARKEEPTEPAEIIASALSSNPNSRSLKCFIDGGRSGRIKNSATGTPWKLSQSDTKINLQPTLKDEKSPPIKIDFSSYAIKKIIHRFGHWKLPTSYRFPYSITSIQCCLQEMW